MMSYLIFSYLIILSDLVLVLQDCKMELSDEDGHRCFPLNDQLLCHACHLKHIQPGGSAPVAASYQL